MNHKDLVARLGVPARLVRHMVAEGVIPEGLETGRGADAWNETHVSIGLRAVALHDMGFNLPAIRLLLEGAAPLPVAKSGPVTLSIDQSVDPADIDVAATLAELASALERYVGQSTKRPAQTEE